MSASLPHRIAVAVVNWGPPEGVRDCLEQLLVAGVPRSSIVVIDNAHPSRQSDAIQKSFAGVTVLAPAANLGFAAGANAGIEWASDSGFEYVFIANNDLTIEASTLPPLVQLLDSDPHVGVVGALPCYRDTGEPHFTRARINWRRGKPAISEGEPPNTEPYETEFVTGCCMLVRLSAVEASGPFDPAYFLYWEDVDLCFRLRESGYKSMMVPSARALHDLSRTTRHSSPLTLYYQTRNRLFFFRRHAPGTFLRAWLTVRISLSRVAKGIMLLFRGRRGEGCAYLRGVRDFYLGRTGIRPEYHRERADGAPVRAGVGR